MTDRRFFTERLAVGLFVAFVLTLAEVVLFGGVAVLTPPAAFAGAVVGFHIVRDTPSLRRRLGDQRAQADSARTMKTAAGIVSTAGLAGLVKNYGIGGVLYELFDTAIGAIDSAGMMFLAPFRAFSGGMGELVDAIVTSPIQIIAESADYTAFSITGGRYGFFGPATFAVGVVSVLGGLLVFTEFIRRMELSPLRLFRGDDN